MRLPLKLDYAGVDGKNFCELAIEIGLCWGRWQIFLESCHLNWIIVDLMVKKLESLPLKRI